MRNPCCPQRVPYWVATESYTAVCDNGTGQVTVTRQGTSTLSMEHARQLARENARKAAQAVLVCTYNSTMCIKPTCGVEMDYPPVCASYESTVSQEDADAQAFALAQQAAINFCTVANISSPFASVLSGDGVVSFSLIPVEGAVGYEYKIDNGAWVDIGNTTSVEDIPVASGNHTLHLRGYDSLGRKGGASAFAFSIS